MSENRFLQTFYAVAASAVLVCSTMLFLVATSEWGHPTSDKDASVPTRVAAAQLSTRSEAEPIARLPIDPPSAAPSLASDQVDFDYTASTADLPQVAEPGASVQGEMSSPETDASVRPDSATRGTALSPSPADAPSDEVGRDPATEADAIASDAVEDASPEVTIAEPSQPTSPGAGDASIAASVERSATEEATPPATPQVAEARAAEPSQSQNSLTNDASKAESVEQPTTQAETPPASPPMDEAKIAEPSPPASSIASDANKDASVEAASVAQATPEAATPPASPLVADVKIAEPSQPASPVASDTSKAASVEQATKPAATSPAKPKVAEVGPPPKPAARPNQAQEASSQPRGKAPWKAMSLAPADKPSISLSKVPTSRPSASGYRAQIWSALARHKPKAGQRGSATVIFAIGQNGALRGVRVGRSSGNTRLDQLALATVRNAAPYPAPPGGAQSFTIRIDFH
jgi:protein TonB